MEENRLRPMPSNYDLKLFVDIYKKTGQLRKKLAWQIDPNRFGVDYKEVLSWFDVKFIHTFSKYHDKKDPELLKAYIISSLQFFKQRILRFSYSQKAQIHNTVDVEDMGNLSVEEPKIDDNKTLLNLSLGVLKSKLSRDAYGVLMIELNPPLYIVACLTDQGKSLTKIPSQLIAGYLGWNEKEGIKKVGICREEIRNAIVEAKEYFLAKDYVI